MKLKSLLAALFFVALLGASAVCSNAQSSPGKDDKTTKAEKENDGEDDEEISAEDRKRVKITVEQARKTALERVAGTIVEEELEKENDRLVFSIEIKDKRGKVFDVEVDAETGAIFKVEEEDEDDEDGADDGDKKETKPPR